MRVLLVEDSDKKFESIADCVAEAVPGALVQRAATMTEAEREIENPGWSLVILDVSLDISPSQHGAKGRGQANIGGLSIAEKMFLLGREAPTIVVTAFDSFTTANVGRTGNEILGFEDVAERVQQLLPDHLVLCLRYNSATWRADMVSAVRKVMLNELPRSS